MGLVLRLCGFLLFVGVGLRLIFDEIGSGRPTRPPDFFEAAIVMHNRLQEMIVTTTEKVTELLVFAGLQ